LEDDEKTSVIPPLYLETSRNAFIFNKGSLNVLCFELLGKTSEGEDAGNTGRETRERSSHDWQKIVMVDDGF
jgi:hypothetical protein